MRPSARTWRFVDLAVFVAGVAGLLVVSCSEAPAQPTEARPLAVVSCPAD